MIEVNKVQNLVPTSYESSDVIMLLKDLTRDMKELPTKERERLIQSGVHYSEMLPQEKAPSSEYTKLYTRALDSKALDIAKGIAKISEIAMLEKGFIKSGNKADTPVIVSLARAGIPVGILMKRYIKDRYGIECEHYAISIIRDKGIDENAMEFIYNNIGDKTPRNIVFVDGWTGKGMIKMQLDEAVKELKDKDSKWEDLSSELYVLADPAVITEFCGTRKDFLLPSACLNSTVSGLISRTILNTHVNVASGDFHGAVYFEKFKDIDKSNDFIDKICNQFIYIGNIDRSKVALNKSDFDSMKLTLSICKQFGIQDFKKVKPGIGETTRVLLRRVPWKVLIDTKVSESDRDIEHILMLCRDKNVAVERFPLGNYKVCGLIKELSADA